MHVIITCKYEKDRIKTSREKVATLDAQGQVTLWSVVGYGRISKSKLLCMSSLPACMKRIQSKPAEKKWHTFFTYYKCMRIFSDTKGQLTPQSVVGSPRISNSFELSCMALLPASMKRFG